MATNQKISSNFDKLPPELVAEIFEYAVLASENSVPILLCLQSVCRRFQEITISTSALWTRPCLPLPLTTLQQWMTRSKPHLLDVFIHPGRQTHDQLSTLLQHMRAVHLLSRTRSLRVTRCAHFLIPDILCVPWPTLRSLDIEFCAFEDDYDCPSPPFDEEWAVDLLAGHGESLRELKLKEVPFDWTRLALRDLRVLELSLPTATWAMELPTIPQFLDTLAKLAELKELVLDNFKFHEVVNGIYVPFNVKREIVNLPKLRRVTLSGPTLHHLRLFLPFLKPGKSIELSISVGFTHLASDIHIPIAPAFFSSVRAVTFTGIGDVEDPDTAFQLAKVEEDFFVITEEDVLRALRQMPALERLEIVALRLEDAFFRHLTLRVGMEEAWISKLDRLVLKACNGFSREGLERMVRSRWDRGDEGRGRLRSVTVDNCVDFEHEPLDGMDRECGEVETQDGVTAPLDQ